MNLFTILLPLAVPLWAYPIEGGIGNLAVFVSWLVGVLWLLMAIVGFAGVSQMDLSRRKSPALTRWCFKGCWLGGIAWVAYHGAFALAGLHATVFVLLLMTAKELKARRVREGNQ